MTHKHTCISCGKSYDCTTEKNQYDGVTICPAKNVNYYCSKCFNEAKGKPNKTENPDEETLKRWEIESDIKSGCNTLSEIAEMYEVDISKVNEIKESMLVFGEGN